MDKRYLAIIKLPNGEVKLAAIDRWPMDINMIEAPFGSEIVIAELLIMDHRYV